MPRLSRAQEGAHRRVLDAVAAGLPPARLGRALVAAIQVAIPIDGYRLFGIDPATRLINRLLAASETDGWARLAWLREAYLAYGPLAYADLSRLMATSVPVAALQERQAACWGYPPDLLAPVAPEDHYRLYHEMETPVGGAIQAVFRANGRWVAALQLYRRDARSPFRPTDVAFLCLLGPTIGDAIGASLAREQALGAVPADAADAAGIIVLGGDGAVRFATPIGERWSDQLRALDAAADGSLPTAVLSAIARLRAASDGGLGVVTVGSPTGFVRVEATHADETGGVAVVLAPVRPPAMPEIPVDWPLTRQEREVVGHALRGADNRGIAAALSIADHTVETHLRNAYEKLDVHGRGQLLARFFRETFWPAIAVGDTPDAR